MITRPPIVDVDKPFKALNVRFYDQDGDEIHVSDPDLNDKWKKWNNSDVYVSDWTEIAELIDTETIFSQYDIRTIEFETMLYNEKKEPILSTLDSYVIDWVEGMRRLMRTVA